MAHAWASPAATATTRAATADATGLLAADPTVPVPSWPTPLAPQQLTEPSDRRTHVKSRPAERSTGRAPGAPTNGPTSTGLAEKLAALPLPSCPEVFAPQQR